MQMKYDENKTEVQIHLNTNTIYEIQIKAGMGPSEYNWFPLCQRFTISKFQIIQMTNEICSEWN